jgi:hypothetical protein
VYSRPDIPICQASNSRDIAEEVGSLTSWNEILRIILLLASRLRECGNPSNDTRNHKNQRYDRPNNTPTLRRASILLCKDAGVGGIDFSKDKVIALFRLSSAEKDGRNAEGTHNIPNAIKRRHNANEKHHIFQRFSMSNEPTGHK